MAKKFLQFHLWPTFSKNNCMESLDRDQYSVSLYKSTDGMVTVKCINLQNKSMLYEKVFHDSTNMFEFIVMALNDGNYDVIDRNDDVTLKIVVCSDIGEQKIKITLSKKVDSKSVVEYVVALEKENARLMDEINDLRREISMTKKKVGDEME